MPGSSRGGWQVVGVGTVTTSDARDTLIFNTLCAGRRKSTVMEYDCGRISTRYHLPAQLAEPQIHILRWLTRHHIFISSDLQFPTPPRGSEHICDN